MGEGQGDWQGVPIPFWGAQYSRRWEGKCQWKSGHVEEPANTARHLRSGDESVSGACQALTNQLVLSTVNTEREERRQCVGLATLRGSSVLH